MHHIQKATVGLIALLMTSAAAFAQTDRATTITSADIQKVLKLGPNQTDHSIRVLDLGDWNLEIAVIHRSRPMTGSGAPPFHQPGPLFQTAPGQGNHEPCGLKSPPPGAKAGPNAAVHDFTPEIYVITHGSGTLLTGGQIVGKRSPSDVIHMKYINGQSCGGKVYGDFVTQKLGVGDVVVIPAGVPHDWTSTDGDLTYLSIRPDPKKVFTPGWTYPGLYDSRTLTSPDPFPTK